jgi:REP element-mobilizing transposase RayT
MDEKKQPYHQETTSPQLRQVAQVSSPVQAFQCTRRNLPHLQEPGQVYFLTWRCRQGQTLAPNERGLVLQALQHYNDSQWRLFAAVILPDHVHALVQPLEHPEGGTYNLSPLIHSVKRFSTHEINRQRGVKGSLWQDERYDRIVRDEAEFLEKWNYIRNNPVKAELTARPEEYPWLYERG